MKYLLCIPIFWLFDAQAQLEFKELFNGKNFSGWKVVYGQADFEIEDGEIVGVSKLGAPNTFLITRKSYRNFILEFEVKLASGLNSGVQIRSKMVDDYKSGRPFGPQVEIEDSDRRWAGGIFDEARKGWRYPMEYNPEAKQAFKKGEWNKFRILAFERRVVTWTNGVQCANLLEDSVETGFIGLQVHSIKNNESLAGKEVRWRDIRLVEIKEDDFKRIEITAPEVSYLPNQLTDSEVSEGWKLLWDGQTTSGWRGAKLSDFPKKGWEIDNGEMTVLASEGEESSNGGDIVTTRKYQNFILEVDFKISEGANSGIKYFVNPDLNKGAGSSIGCEFQILDDKRHPDAKKGVGGNRTIGSLYDLITSDGTLYNSALPKKKYVNAIGNWNRARIEVDGGNVSHYLNGCKVVDYQRDTQMWKALVAYSKYKKWPAFGESSSGHILLQDHGDRVSFRSIKINELE